MDSLIDMVSIVFKFLFGVVLFYLGYFFLKIITLGKFPKSTKEAILYPGPMLMATVGILGSMATVQILFFIIR